MQPALPEEPSGEDAWFATGEVGEVGEFRPGSPVSRWALSRYLVGRAIAESVSRTLLIAAVVLLAAAAAVQWGVHLTVVTVLLVLAAVMVLVLRWILRAVLRGLIATDHRGPVDGRLRALVADTRTDVLREMRRVGLPSHTVTLPLLAIRLLGRRRRQTVERLRDFDIDRAVPKMRLDELHLLLRRAADRPGGPGPVAP